MCMKKMFIALLLVPMLEAKEYTFACNSSGGKAVSIKVDTEEKYIIFDDTTIKSLKWEENEDAIIVSHEPERGLIEIIKIDKITSIMKQTFQTENGITMFSLNYTCKPAERLMP